MFAVESHFATCKLSSDCKHFLFLRVGTIVCDSVWHVRCTCCWRGGVLCVWRVGGRVVCVCGVRGVCVAWARCVRCFCVCGVCVCFFLPNEHTNLTWTKRAKACMIHISSTNAQVVHHFRHEMLMFPGFPPLLSCHACLPWFLSVTP